MIMPGYALATISTNTHPCTNYQIVHDVQAKVRGRPRPKARILGGVLFGIYFYWITQLAVHYYIGMRSLLLYVCKNPP